jgi:malate dehydrogenase (oxaloacetate-decarboxylating)(NADP+)
MTKTSLDDDALALHAQGRPGKLEISATKPLTTQRDLSLAYSPGRGRPLPPDPCRSGHGL